MVMPTDFGPMPGRAAFTTMAPSLTTISTGWSEATFEALPELALLVAEEVEKRSAISSRCIDTVRVGRHGVSAFMNLTSFPWSFGRR
jgi:hypothetical protein